MMELLWREQEKEVRISSDKNVYTGIHAIDFLVCYRETTRYWPFLRTYTQLGCDI